VSGTVRARYVYSPFGVTVEQSGDLADTFLFRFSTKPFHQATGLYKYQLRDYHPLFGKWLSRDPLGDEAFLQQYTSDMSRSESKHWRERSMHPTYLFVQNNPLLFFDYLGLDLRYSGCKCCPEIDDAVRRANRAFRKGTCKEWFEEHGHN
jgi:RHS repeat-associated protein